jgi:hypothetical protein
MTPKNSENHIIINSPSLNSLIRQYKSYVFDCVRNLQPIADIKTFYLANRKKNGFKTSRTYEEYLYEMSIKQ